MQTGNLTMVYGAVAALSVLLLLGYLFWEKNKERNFLFLISCVASLEETGSPVRSDVLEAVI